jgi:ligand-binding sensor domain-containing protein
MNRLIPKFFLIPTLLAISLLAGALFGINWGIKFSTPQESSEMNQEISAVSQPPEEINKGGVDTKQTLSMPIYNRWRTFTKQDGLPSDKAHCVRVDGERVWVGTDAGLALYEKGRWRTYTVDDGLAHPVVLSIDVSPYTGDVWIATMGGLNRWSAGRFDKFDQFNSGLSNDVVYGVACDERYVWAATASGASRLNTYTDQWTIFNTKNAPMHEPWAYSVSAKDSMVYIAVWGGGVVEFNTRTERWRDYRDPDKEMELDIFPDDGLVHDVTASVSYENGILWVATYFGLNRYDGSRWWGYFDHDSGLASNFVNFVRARGSAVWICTDKGLNSFDGKTWVTYRRNPNNNGGEVLISDGATGVKKWTYPTTIAHNFVLGVDFQGDTLWVTTAKGVSQGVAQRELTIQTP